MQNLKKKLQEIVASKHYSKYASIAFLAIIIAIVPLTVFVAQQNQDNRQHANADDNGESSSDNGTTTGGGESGCSSRNSRPEGCSCHASSQCASHACAGQNGNKKCTGTGGQGGTPTPTPIPCTASSHRPNGCTCTRNTQCATSSCSVPNGNGNTKYCGGVLPTTPTPTVNTPTPTASVSVTPTITGTITPTITSSITPTITGAPGTTGIAFVLTFQPHELPGGNQSPVHPVRQAQVTLYQPGSQDKVATAALQLTFVKTPSPMFTGIASFTVSAGQYDVKVSIPQYLTKKFPNQTLSTSTNTMPKTQMIVGDVNSDNSLDILDYNIITQTCFGTRATLSTSCTAADLDDNGTIDIFDANYLFRNFAIRNGD